MPWTRSNWFMGIRTPWTLSSERVWEKTHRLGGWVFIGAGLLLLVTAFVGQRTDAMLWIIGLVILVCVIAPVAYSYFAYQQETRLASEETNKTEQSHP